MTKAFKYEQCNEDTCVRYHTIYLNLTLNINITSISQQHLTSKYLE